MRLEKCVKNIETKPQHSDLLNVGVDSQRAGTPLRTLAVATARPALSAADKGAATVEQVALKDKLSVC